MDTQSTQHSRVNRLILGFFLAPLLPAILYGYASGGVALFFAVPIAYASTIVLGIPAYFVLQPLVRPTISVVILTGGLVAALPWLWIFFGSYFDGPHYSEFNGRVSHADGHMTWLGIINHVQGIGTAFVLGMLGGIVFWFCVRPRKAVPQEESA